MGERGKRHVNLAVEPKMSMNPAPMNPAHEFVSHVARLGGSITSKGNLLV